MFICIYRPKDSSTIGLTNIAILGHTIFSNPTTGSSNSNCSVTNCNNKVQQAVLSQDQFDHEDNFAKSSVGWIRILSRCLDSPAISNQLNLESEILKIVASYPGFLQASCNLLNLLPLNPYSDLNKLEQIMLKLGRFDTEYSLTIIKLLLRQTFPQGWY